MELWAQKCLENLWSQVLTEMVHEIKRWRLHFMCDSDVFRAINYEACMQERIMEMQRRGIFLQYQPFPYAQLVMLKSTTSVAVVVR